MDDASLDRLLAGDLSRLPSLPKRVVRLFISSTFTDMTLERNSLMERVYPRLKKYCRERHGLDFQVVDMRWGVRDEATDDHQTVNLCSREIETCQRVSLGPNFVALIGDKYGFRPLLNRIKSTEYRSLRRCLIESDINTDFLDTWFKEDLNAVPAEYLLQPISSILKNFTNKSEPELQMVDQRIWQAIQERLHDLLLIGSERLVRQGRMSERERNLKYSISVTEREVLEGCLELNETKSHCLVYVRSIVDLRGQLARYFDDLSRSAEAATKQDEQHQLGTPDEPFGTRKGSHGSGEMRRDSANRKPSLKIGEDTISLATSGAHTSAGRKLERQRRLISKFIDLTSKEGGTWKVDEDAQEALGELKMVKLRDKLGNTRRNLTVYEVHWNEQDGISAKSEEHKQYLNDLTEHFYQNLTRMIRNAVKAERKVKTSGLTGEVLQHSHYSLQVAAKVHGRSCELEQIRTYIQMGSCHQASVASSSGLASSRPAQTVVLPMFLYGVSGSGKTSVLARVATLAADWIKQAAAYRRRSSASTSLSTMKTIADELALPERWDRTPCIITRFCCTTPASSSMVGMLTSVCRQLQYNFHQFGPLNGLSDKQPGEQQQQQQRARPSGYRDQLTYKRIPEDFVRLVHTFRQLLNNCQHHLHKRRLFVIIIDSVERLLAPAECSLEAKYSWLTSLTRLPPNVRLIVSSGSTPTTGGGHTSASGPDDYLHLKRHFLQVHLKLWEANMHKDCNSTRSSLADHESDGLSSGTESVARLSEADFADSHRPRSQAVRSSISRFQLLRRLVLPVARLARGSRSFTFEESQAIARQATARHASVRFGPMATALGGKAELDDGLANEAAKVTRVGSAVSSDSSQSADVSHAAAPRPNQSAYTGTGLLHIKPLGAQLGQAVLRQWLAESGRNLSQQQWAIVNKSLARCSRPIFVKLALGEVISWKSYSMQGDTKGLTFGSAWLGDFSLESKGGLAGSLCPELEELCRSISRGGEQERARYKWQILSMEQQWLNYLDYRSRRAETRPGDGGQAASQREHPGTTGDSGNLVIRVAASRGSANSAATRTGTAAHKGAALVISATGSSSSSGGGRGPSSLSICHLSDTIEDAICQLFARIELQHGYLLTKHSLSYITAARNGICENELEDILSLDDVVLDDVFQYHLPPVRRIPPLLWTRIRNDLPDYLSERDADGIVVAWHHNQFKSVTERRYLSDDSQLVYIHSLLADYFMGKWADKPKPFRCTKQQVQMAAEQLESAVQQSMRRDSDQAGRSGPRSSLTGTAGRLGSGSGRSGASFSVRNRLRSSDQHDQRLQWMQAKALRRVPHQPIYYDSSGPSGGDNKFAAEGGDGGGGGGATGALSGRQEEADKGAQRASYVTVKRRYNLRKLTELPHHLVRSGRFLDLAQLVIFNYRWLYASIDALGLQSLFDDLDEARRHLELELARRRAQSRAASSERGTEDESDGEQDGDDLFSGQQGTTTGGPPDQAVELSVAGRDNLSALALVSLVEQVCTLSDTLRLSSSVLHSQPHMLASQLIGRLFPAVQAQQTRHRPVGDTSLGVQAAPVGPRDQYRRSTRSTGAGGGALLFLDKLLEQCYKDGPADCALLPLGHCLCTSDGLKLGSLEGHPFGVTAMALASDQRHLLAVSSKFLMWNISTGEIAREIEPKLSGSVIRGLAMSRDNQFALAYTSENLVLALEILTQQVARLDLRGELVMTEDGDQIASLGLIDQRAGRRFFVWTRMGLLVVMRLEEEKEDAAAAGRARRTSPAGNPTNVTAAQEESPECEFFIAIEYQVDQLLSFLPNLGGAETTLAEVAVAELEPDKTHLVFLTLAVSDAEKPETAPQEMRLETLKVDLDSRGYVEKVEVWPADSSERRVSSLALSKPNMSQLVVAHSEGTVCLRRRRATSWSAPKEIWRTTRGGSAREELAPLAIELESDLDSWASAGSGVGSELGPRAGQADHQLRERLADFEAKIDGACEEIREVSRRVFEVGRVPGSEVDEKRLAGRISDQVNFVKLYWAHCIVVVRLDCRSGGNEEARGKSRRNAYRCACLTLPRDIRNVRLEPNRSQLMSKITAQPEGAHDFEARDSPSAAGASHYLIVAANRKLLIYSLENEQLLKCFEAHAKRITSLLVVSAKTSPRQLGAPEGPLPSQEAGQLATRGASASVHQFGHWLATCSLDCTVNIWNLRNMNREEKQIERLRSKSSSSASIQFETVHVNSQLPIAACLASGQLSIWHWPTSRQRFVFDSTADLAAGTKGAPFNRCKFSASGRYLAATSLAPAVHLLACQGPQLSPGGDSLGSRARGAPVASTPCSVEQVAMSCLHGGEGPIRSVDFFAQDSRLLVVAELAQEQRRESIQSSQSSPGREHGDELRSATLDTSDEADDDDGDEEEEGAPSLFDRVSIICLEVPEMRRIYSLESSMPRSQQCSHGGHSFVGKRSSRKRAELTNCPGDPLGASKRNRMVSLTSDQQLFVVLEARPAEAGGQCSFDRRKQRRRSSALNRPQIVLGLYSARDGKFVTSIDLSQLETSEQQLAPSRLGRPSGSHHLEVSSAVARSKQNGAPSKRTSSRAQAEGGGRVVSLRACQFNRLRAMKSRERQSIVALIDDRQGVSYLIDINSRLLLASSDSWSGRVSSDGRYGLSRLASNRAGGRSLALAPVKGAHSADTLPSDGLRLLEMRHCQTLRVLLSSEQLNSLRGRGAASLPTGSPAGGLDSSSADNGDMLCGFTKPNLAYVYLCDRRQLRLLLVRTRDCQLVANYKLATPVSHVKCSGDGLALILAQTDGALIPLAIVDPQSGDTQASRLVGPLTGQSLMLRERTEQ